MLKRIALAVGGTGGHLFPAQTLATILQGDYEVAFFGHGLAQNPFFKKENRFFEIEAAPLKKGFFGKTMRGTMQAYRALKAFGADGVIGFGSFHTFPVLSAAMMLRKKIALFEANAVLGRVNRLFSPFSEALWMQFPSRKARGVPLLPWKPKSLPSRKEALAYFGLNPDKKTLLVFGGSQGASFFNEVVPKVSFSGDWQILHLTGGGNVHYSISSCVKPFETNMPFAYAAADCVLCRAGASTLAELIAFEKSALLIPFPKATEEHQKKNGIFFVQKGAGRMVLQEEASPDRIEKELSLLLEREEEHRASLREIKQEASLRNSVEEEVRRWITI